MKRERQALQARRTCRADVTRTEGERERGRREGEYISVDQDSAGKLPDSGGRRGEQASATVTHGFFTDPVTRAPSKLAHGLDDVGLSPGGHPEPGPAGPDFGEAHGTRGPADGSPPSLQPLLLPVHPPR